MTTSCVDSKRTDRMSQNGHSASAAFDSEGHRDGDPRRRLPARVRQGPTGSGAGLAEGTRRRRETPAARVAPSRRFVVRFGNPGTRPSRFSPRTARLTRAPPTVTAEPEPRALRAPTVVRRGRRVRGRGRGPVERGRVGRGGDADTNVVVRDADDAFAVRDDDDGEEAHGQRDFAPRRGRRRDARRRECVFLRRRRRRVGRDERLERRRV